VEHVESYENVISAESQSQNVMGASVGTPNGLGRKRKRKVDDDEDSNLESRYLQRLSNEGSKNVAGFERRGKQQRRAEKDHPPFGEGLFPRSDAGNSIDVNMEDQLAAMPPLHESLSLSAEKLELEKASRTVFLGNVSTIAIKSKTARSTLIDYLESFLSNLPERDIAHKLESIRFRSTAFASSGLPKKAAYAKKELMDSTTKSTNAYAVYTTQSAAREAVTKLNGTVIFDRHLRVDGVAHPAKVDHHRCVFVGNLGFVDDESVINAANDKENNKPPRKRREPADAEEGLWRQFSKAGIVESVRVIRDKTTRVGKGFAYVQFQVSHLLSSPCRWRLFLTVLERELGRESIAI
jgi:nucleolar protein 12